MFITAIMTVIISFMTGAIVCLAWQRKPCVNCRKKNLSIERFEREICVLKNEVAMMNHSRAQQVKRRLEQLQSKKKEI